MFFQDWKLLWYLSLDFLIGQRQELTITIKQLNLLYNHLWHENENLVWWKKSIDNVYYSFTFVLAEFIKGLITVWLELQLYHLLCLCNQELKYEDRKNCDTNKKWENFEENFIYHCFYTID